MKTIMKINKSAAKCRDRERLPGRTFLATLFALAMLVINASEGQAQVSREISYVNLSRPNGGIVSSGDTLEIRCVISVVSGTTIYNVRYNGTIPINTTYIAGTLAARTNEGQTGFTNTGNYTDAAGDDRAQIVGTNIIMNMGQTAGVPPANGGSIVGGTTVPVSWSVTIIQATFRVRVSGANGTQVVTAGNSFSYSSTSGGASVSYPMSDFGILVAPQYGCSALDATNRITDELGGTYYTGTAQNRISSPIVTGFTYTTIASNRPNDGSYAVVKNTSHTQTTNTAASNSNRVFSTWQIFGDHTGTTTAAGNPPAGNGASGGYMLIVNASYSPSSVFTTTVSGVLPYSTYTFSFWIRNLCGNCSANPNGGGRTGDGVLPNLALSINGLDHYTSGTIPANAGWVQKSITFTTGNYTTANINLRNNAPGGGGNDWAIDDFEMYECLVILPVSLNELSASYSGGTTLVSWSTGKDESVDKYIVEYSLDGKLFQTAGEVKATGNGGKYSFTDARNVNGKMYYRVMVLDKNSRAQYSKVMIVRNEMNQEVTMKVSPNPVQANPTITLVSESRQGATVKLLDYSGRSVLSVSRNLNRGTNSFVLNTPSSLSKGLYVVQVVFADGNIVTEKVLIGRQ